MCGRGSYHSEHRIQQPRLVVLTELQTAMPAQVEGSNIIYGVTAAPTARARARERAHHLELMFKKWPIVSLLLNQSKHYSRQLRRNRRVGLAPQISIEWIAANIVAELAAEAVLAHAHGASGLEAQAHALHSPLQPGAQNRNKNYPAIIGLSMILLLTGPVYADQNWINWSSSWLMKGGVSSPTASPSGTPASTPTASIQPTPQPNSNQPLGVFAPAGHSWGSAPVFDDEFNGNSINTALWNGGYSGPLYWCAASGNYCGSSYANESESGGNLVQEGVNGGSPNAAVINSGGTFSQQYGYWEVQGQMPNRNGGNGLDPAFYMFTTGMGQDPGSGFANSSQTDWEMDLFELGGETANAPDFGDTAAPGDDVSKLLGYYATIHQANGQYMWYCGVKNDVPLDQGMHTFGMSWYPTSSCSSGQVQFYLDGNACVIAEDNGTPGAVCLGGYFATEGVYMLFQNRCANGLQFNGGISCDSSTNTTSNPALWNYVRVWTYN
jgi:hypothetical protein